MPGAVCSYRVQRRHPEALLRKAVPNPATQEQPDNALCPCPATVLPILRACRKTTVPNLSLPVRRLPALFFYRFSNPACPQAIVRSPVTAPFCRLLFLINKKQNKFPCITLPDSNSAGFGYDKSDSPGNSYLVLSILPCTVESVILISYYSTDAAVFQPL